MGGEAHRFDRRESDANVAALALRVGTVEGRLENVELRLATNNRELEANTALTKQTHEKVERVETNTQMIVNAVRWFSTTKRLVLAACVMLSGVAGTIVMTVKALHMLGLIR